MGQDVHDITTSLQHEGFWPKVGIERQSYIYPNDPCFEWRKGLLLEGSKEPQNRGETSSRYIYIFWVVPLPSTSGK